MRDLSINHLLRLLLPRTLSRYYTPSAGDCGSYNSQTRLLCTSGQCRNICVAACDGQCPHSLSVSLAQTEIRGDHQRASLHCTSIACYLATVKWWWIYIHTFIRWCFFPRLERSNTIQLYVVPLSGTRNWKTQNAARFRSEHPIKNKWYKYLYRDIQQNNTRLLCFVLFHLEGLVWWRHLEGGLSGVRTTA